MKSRIVINQRRLRRVEILCLKSKATSVGKRLLDTGWTVVNSQAVHRILAHRWGVVKTCPAGRSLDVLPDWIILVAEKDTTRAKPVHPIVED
jgi:hypothetical protein